MLVAHGRQSAVDLAKGTRKRGWASLPKWAQISIIVCSGFFLLTGVGIGVHIVVVRTGTSGKPEEKALTVGKIPVTNTRTSESPKARSKTVSDAALRVNGKGSEDVALGTDGADFTDQSAPLTVAFATREEKDTSKTNADRKSDILNEPKQLFKHQQTRRQVAFGTATAAAIGVSGIGIGAFFRNRKNLKYTRQSSFLLGICNNTKNFLLRHFDAPMTAHFF